VRLDDEVTLAEAAQRRGDPAPAGGQSGGPLGADPPPGGGPVSDSAGHARRDPPGDGARVARRPAPGVAGGDARRAARARSPGVRV